MARGVRSSAMQVFAALLLVVAATLMPWATYRDVQTDATTTFRGGPLSVLLVAFGTASIVLSLLLLTRNAASLYKLQLVIGSAALIDSIALALSKISLANHVAMAQETASRTAYSFGGGVAILASAAIALISIIELGSANVASRNGSTRPDDSTAFSRR
jgi:amino acid transporter